jgi:protein CpxP
MKKLMIIALAFVTTIGFSQDRERNQEMRQKMQQERQSLTPEQRAEINTKRLTIQLDLTEAQQKEVFELQLANAKHLAEKREEIQNNAEKSGVYERANFKLDMQKDIHDKMKLILTESQYTIWKENLKKGKRNKGSLKQKRKQ